MALALVAAAALLFEVTLVRLLSVALWYPFAFAAIATAMLGFGAAAVLYGLSARLRAAPPRQLLAVAAVAMAGAIALGYPAWNALPVDPMSLGADRTQLVWVPLLLLLLALPFACHGLFVAKSFGAWTASAARLYAADLGGAALGVALYVVLLPRLGGPGTLLAAASLAALASLLMLGDRLAARVAVALLIAGLLGAATHVERLLPLRITENKLLGSKLARTLPRGSLWTLSSAIDVIEPAKTADPIIVIDGGTALTWVPRALKDGSYPPASGLRALPYRLSPGRSTLVIGSGGGVEVQAALVSGSTRILAIEIDPAINALVTGRLNNILGGLFHEPAVELVTAEARSYLAATAERFDVIAAFHTISNAAASTGAMSLAESYLLTTEAMRLLFDRLSDGGVLVISRPEPQLGRLAFTLATAWPFADEIAHHVAVVTNSRAEPDFMAAVVVTRRPLSPADIDVIRSVTPGRIAFVPSGGGDRQAFFAAALARRPIGDLAAALPYRPATFTPATDDRPFFNLVRPWHELSLADVEDVLASGERSRDRLEDRPVGQVAVLLLLLEATLLAALLLIPPVLALKRRQIPRRRVLGTATYFGALGFAYITVEVVLIQTLTRILGEPSVSLLAVLAVLLAASGAGSLVLVGRLNLPPRLATLGALLAALFVALVVPQVADAAAAWPLVLRLVTASLLVLPAGFVMGAPFSAGMRPLEREDLVAWAWAVNSLLSVGGSIGALVLGSALGFTGAGVTAAAAYGLAALADRSLDLSPERPT